MSSHVLPPGIVKTSKQQLKAAIRVIPQQQCKPICWGIPCASLFDTVLPTDLLLNTNAKDLGSMSRLFAGRFFSSSPAKNPYQTVYVSFPHNISGEVLLNNLRSFGRSHRNCYFYLDTWSFPRGPTTATQIRQRIFECDVMLCVLDGDASFYRNTLSRMTCLYEIFVAMAYKKTVFFSSFSTLAESLLCQPVNFATACTSSKERAQDLIASVPRANVVERAVWTAMYMAYFAKRMPNKPPTSKGKKTNNISPLHRFVLTKNHDPLAVHKHLIYDSC